MGADTGVVADWKLGHADRGVVRAVEAVKGVKGVRVCDRGESSAREESWPQSLPLLPERMRLCEICLARRGTLPMWVGMTRGASCFGEMGCRGVWFSEADR